MKDSTFTIDQIMALRELEKSRLKQGRPGFREDLQFLLHRLSTDDESGQRELRRHYEAVRRAQTTILFDKGFGEVFKSYEDYLAMIPEVPEKLQEGGERFPALVLVDTRLGITKSCKLAGLKYDADDQTFKDFDPKRANAEQVYWMRCQDGRKNQGKSVSMCRQNFTENELGLTAMEGIALYIQNPGVVKAHNLHLVGSVIYGDCSFVANLGHGLGELKLDWCARELPLSRSGSASRLE